MNFLLFLKQPGLADKQFYFEFLTLNVIKQ